MSLSKEMEVHLVKCFDFHLKHFERDIRAYQNELIATLKETELKHNQVDQLFIYEISEQGFVYNGKKRIEEIESEMIAKKNLFTEVKDILKL